MSTGLECQLVKVTASKKPDKWYYILEDGSAPKNAWDWREYASAYGSFASEDEAHEHLHHNHANPGGYSRVDYTEEEVQTDKLLADLLQKAHRGRRLWYA